MVIGRHALDVDHDVAERLPTGMPAAEPGLSPAQGRRSSHTVAAGTSPLQADRPLPITFGDRFDHALTPQFSFFGRLSAYATMLQLPGPLCAA